MFRKRKYAYETLRKVGIDDNIIRDLLEEKISKEDIDTIATSKYPYDTCRLMVTKGFREYPNAMTRSQMISIIDSSEHSFQAYYSSMTAINKNVLSNDRILSIIYNVSRARKTEFAKTAYEVAIDKNLLEIGYAPVATAMAAQGVSSDKIYEFAFPTEPKALKRTPTKPNEIKRS